MKRLIQPLPKRVAEQSREPEHSFTPQLKSMSSVRARLRQTFRQQTMTETKHQAELPDTSAAPSRPLFGGAGLAFALLALVAAVMSPWIIDAIEPERKPADEAAVEFATKIKDRLIAKAKRQEYVPPVEEKAGLNIAKSYPAGTIALGLCGICLGVGGFCRHEDIRITGSSVAVGLAAIVFQYFLLLAAAIIFIMLVAIILSAIGIDLPTP